MNISPQYFDQAKLVSPYILTMQIRTDHLHAFSAGTIKKPIAKQPIDKKPIAKQHLKPKRVPQQSPNQTSAQPNQTQTSQHAHRTNQEWVIDLSDATNPEGQRAAHEELSHYTYVVAYNYLLKRTNDIQRLNAYKSEEIVELAKDFVQSFMVKLVKDEYALLDKYSGLGRFPAWTAQVITNLIASELRRPYWQKQYMPYDGLQVAWVIDEETVAPQSAVEIGEVTDTLNHLLNQLSEQQREILLRCTVEGERAANVAKELGITPNTVYIIAHRAKAKMRKLLVEKGINATTLAIFNP